MRKLSLVLLILAAVAGLAKTSGGTETVAVIISADIEPYQKALKGFKETVGDRIIVEYDMEGDVDRGRKILAEIQSNVNPNLILAIGLWALQVVSSQSTDLPVVYAMVLNPPSILDPTVKNITGASMNVPVDETIRFVKQLVPRIRRIGVIFTPAKTGYLVRQADTVAREEGLQLISEEIRSPKDAVQAVKSLQEKGIDALWILPDDTVLNPKVLEYVFLVSYRKQIPIFGLSERQTQMGALLSLSFASSEDIGRQAGELARAILRGQPATEVPYTTVRQVKLTVNLKAARRLRMEIPNSILARANAVIQ